MCLIKSVYLISGNTHSHENDQQPFCACVFVKALVHLSVSESSPSSFPCSTPICFVKRQFTFQRIVWRNARQEGRRQNNGYCGNRAKKETHPVPLQPISVQRKALGPNPVLFHLLSGLQIDLRCFCQFNRNHGNKTHNTASKLHRENASIHN